MATDTGRRLLIPLCDLPAVDARHIFRLLVHAHCRVVALHDFGIAMALSAESLNLAGRWRSDESFTRVHRAIVIIIIWIPAMTAGA
jgi:hypothetical protein